MDGAGAGAGAGEDINSHAYEMNIAVLLASLDIDNIYNDRPIATNNDNNNDELYGEGNTNNSNPKSLNILTTDSNAYGRQ